MLQIGAAVLGTGLVFGALDAIWLTVMGSRLYKPVLGDMLRDTPAIGPAAAFYIIYVLGVVIIAVLPGVREASVGKTAGTAAVLGFMAYATYTLTNHATLARWSTTLSIGDLLWGCFLTTTAAVGGYYAARLVA
ncbi:MAG: DUF2177 family protein [Brevundimonas sp.]|uniref:DUF2177 family protein n=1 Tax=Brevundimonas sp. TaxID=1871086 RepID=UPI00391BE555